MKISIDNPKFNEILKEYFNISKFNLRTLCSIDNSGKILGGWGFSPVYKGNCFVYALKLYQNWISVDLCKKVLVFPFEELGAERVTAVVKNNPDSKNLALHLGGKLNELTGEVVFYKSASIELSKRFKK